MRSRGKGTIHRGKQRAAAEDLVKRNLAATKIDGVWAVDGSTIHAGYIRLWATGVLPTMSRVGSVTLRSRKVNVSVLAGNSRVLLGIVSLRTYSPWYLQRPLHISILSWG
jgi:hypothetical protein